MAPTPPDILLISFAEFLDTQGLMVAPEEGDARTHEDLVREFTAEYADSPIGETLALLKQLSEE